ncbi:MAG: hypothetical protein PVH00_13145, partial [Gemmatimonadota bacterium]
MRGTMRAAAVCVLLLGGVAGWASAEKAVALPCADYVSTQIWDEPDTGHLIGTETITYTLQVSPGGVGATVTTTFEVGTYELTNGGSVRL